MGSLFQGPGDYLVAVVFINVVGGLLLGGFGSDRKVGFAVPFIVSVFFSPVVGLFVLLNSPTLKDLAAEQKRHDELTKAARSGVSKAEELERLLVLADKGVLSVDEFEKLKNELI